MNLGAHMSIAGGMHLALTRGKENTCGIIQLFVKNQRQWNASPLTEEDISAFQCAKKETGIREVIAHGTYLINLASPKEDLWHKSIDGFVLELERCEALDISGLVVHPGSHVGSGEEVGLRRVAEAMNLIHRRTPGYKTKVLLETTAGQGTNLGHRFEHLRDIMDGLEEPGRVGICIDTCHIFAAGYDIRKESSYRATMDEFNSVIGNKWIKAFHLNDSKVDLGARVDRHEHIGKGKIGSQGFAALLNDKRFHKIPMALETPKDDDMDRNNLKKLRRLRIS